MKTTEQQQHSSNLHAGKQARFPMQMEQENADLSVDDNYQQQHTVATKQRDREPGGKVSIHSSKSLGNIAYAASGFNGKCEEQSLKPVTERKSSKSMSGAIVLRSSRSIEPPTSLHFRRASYENQQKGIVANQSIHADDSMALYQHVDRLTKSYVHSSVAPRGDRLNHFVTATDGSHDSQPCSLHRSISVSMRRSWSLSGNNVTFHEKQQNKEKKKVIIYVTQGVKNGLSWRRTLMEKFLAVVEPDPCTEIVFPHWADLPFPTDVTCGVSDDAAEERTQKLLRQGVLVVQSSWMITCLAERKLLLPVDEEKFGLKPDIARCQSDIPIIKFTHANYRSDGKFIWKSHHYDVLFALVRAHDRKDSEAVGDLETVLFSHTCCTREEMESRLEKLQVIRTTILSCPETIDYDYVRSLLGDKPLPNF